jgi:hypothetical protein
MHRGENSWSDYNRSTDENFRYRGPKATTNETMTKYNNNPLNSLTSSMRHAFDDGGRKKERGPNKEERTRQELIEDLWLPGTFRERAPGTTFRDPKQDRRNPLRKYTPGLPYYEPGGTKKWRWPPRRRQDTEGEERQCIVG